MNQKTVDLLILGGGINGAGIALDAVSRGLKVALVEKNDFSSATSSASSKLIHGGLRYLEHLNFSMVRQSLQERDRLLQNASHLVHPIEFLIPHNPKLRSSWMMKLGLFIYDHLSTSHLLPKAKTLKLSRSNTENPLCLSYKKAFRYFDAKVDDARLVISLLLKAKSLGVECYSHAECRHFQKSHDHWICQLRHHQKSESIQARVVVNATGPWAQEVVEQEFGLQSNFKLKKVKGSHIVVPKLYPQDHAYLLQHPDSRAVFVIPFNQQFTMIGTTDKAHEDCPSQAQCSNDETDYLCRIVSKYFHHPLKPSQVVHHWSGVRPLVERKASGLSNLSREHQLELLGPSDGPYLLNVFGGKLTTYRHLAQSAVDLLKPIFPYMQGCQTKSMSLPGSDRPKDQLKTLLHELQQSHPYLPSATLSRYMRQYGSRTIDLLKECRQESDLGEEVGYGLYEREIEFLANTEWATRAEDILWRRTKLGLLFQEHQVLSLEQKLVTLQRRQIENVS